MSDITVTTVFTHQSKAGRNGLSTDHGGWLVRYDDPQGGWQLVDKVDLPCDLGHDDLVAHYGVYLAPKTGLFHTRPNTANPPERLEDKRVERFSDLEHQDQELVVRDAAGMTVDVDYGHLSDASLKHDSGPGQVTMTQGWTISHTDHDGPFIGTWGYGRLSGLRDGQRFKDGGPY